MKNTGTEIACVWRNLRPATRKLLRGALAATASLSPVEVIVSAGAAHEMSRLLAALDQQLELNRLPAPARQDLRQLADTCAAVLQAEACSAKIFAQLVERAYRRHDFARLCALGELLAARFAPQELCLTLRHPHPVVRALGHEALVNLPTTALARLLSEPAQADLARYALECQALDYGSEAAHEILFFLDDEEGEFCVAE